MNILYSSATNWMYIEHRSLSMRNNTYNWLITFNNCNNQLILPKRLTFVARPRSIQPVITLTTFSMTFYITSHDCPYLSTISIITFIAQSLSWQLVIMLMKLCIKIDEYFEFLIVTWNNYVPYRIMSMTLYDVTPLINIPLEWQLPFIFCPLIIRIHSQKSQCISIMKCLIIYILHAQ